MAEHFGRTSRVKVTMEYETPRFTSRDSAIQEGTMKVTSEKTGSSSKRFSIMGIKEDGKWLLAFIKDWAGRTRRPERSRLADRLVTAKQGDKEVKTKYEWFGNKGFIKAEFTIHGKDRAFTAMQIIGEDPKTGDLRTWIFEADGGFGSGTVEREGNKWVFESETVLTDGSILTAKNILVQVNKDTFTWQSVDLSVDDEPYGNLGAG